MISRNENITYLPCKDLLYIYNICMSENVQMYMKLSSRCRTVEADTSPTEFRIFEVIVSVADPDLELRRGGGGLDFLALLAFFPSVFSSFFTQNKGGGLGPPGSLP